MKQHKRNGQTSTHVAKAHMFEILVLYRRSTNVETKINKMLFNDPEPTPVLTF